MKKAKIFSLICAAAMSAVVTSSCGSGDESYRYDVIPPVVMSSDGESFSIDCGNFYQAEINDQNRKYAERICEACGKETSDEAFNSVCFGENIFGVGLASVVYFGKYSDSLSDEEWELLCDIAESPTKYVSALNAEQKDYDKLLNVHAPQASRIPTSAYFDAMIEEIVSDLSEQKKYSRSEAFKLIYSGGVTIKTPYSNAVQNAVDEVYSDNGSFSANTDDKFPQSACVVIDYSGGVSAAAGGNNGNTAYNRAYRILHPIGSSVKPLSVYTPAIENKLITFSSVVPDMPLDDGSNNAYGSWPQNYNGVYEGDVTATYALRQSKNTVAVWLAQSLGTQFCLDFMRDNFMFTTLTEDDANLSAMAMGYLSQGVSLPELTAAYGVFGNNGIYYAPRFYDEVLDSDGNVIISKKSQVYQSVSSQTAWIMNRMLKYNISGQDAIAGSAQLDNGTEVIGKTGTMNNSSGDDTERIFVGATPEYVTAVWVGMDAEGAAISNFSYTPPTELWKNIMTRIPCAKTEFELDTTVVSAEYCTASGGLAGSRCPDKETGYYFNGTVPTQCTMH